LAHVILLEFSLTSPISLSYFNFGKKSFMKQTVKLALGQSQLE
jgi:hypothetical protein